MSRSSPHQVTLNHRISTAGVTAITLMLSGCGLFSGPPPSLTEPQSASARATTVSSQEDRLRRHVYAGTGLGPSWMEPDASEVPSYTVNDRVETGGQITLGVDINKYLSAEVHSADLGSAGFDPGGRINYHIHGASALVYAGGNRESFKRQGLTGYGRVGVGYLENSPVGNVPFVKRNETHVLFGAGAEYMTRIGLGLRAEAIAYETDARYGQLGVIYRTGRRAEQKAVEIVETPAPVILVEPEPEPVAAVAAPEPIPYNPCEAFNGVLEGVNFHTDSAVLTAGAQGMLDRVAATLSQCETAPVNIAAHTDSVGSQDYNQELSKRRAKSVARYLSKRGVAVSRMTARAFGEIRPIAPNETADGRRQNRRVELIAR